jgi:hypothetical protein
MTTPETEWQLSEVRNAQETMLIRKKLGAPKGGVLSGNDYVIYLTFGCAPPANADSCYTQADADTLLEIDRNDIPTLEEKAGAELVAAVSARRVRDYIFYSDDPDTFLESALYLRRRFPQFRIGCECKPDPKWEQYHDLPPVTSDRQSSRTMG